jgi:hypothetical protein
LGSRKDSLGSRKDSPGNLDNTIIAINIVVSASA